MPKTAGLLIALVVLPASTLAPPAAMAQGAADIALARELFREGSRSAKSGDWETARNRYQRSLQLKRAAITLHSLGIASWSCVGALVTTGAGSRSPAPAGWLVNPADVMHRA